jgi:hypothetical protein
MSYKVYKASYLGAPRNHHAIFVETESDGNGVIFQVTGDIQNGMRYESKKGKRLEDSNSFVSKEYLGAVSSANFLRVGTVCSSNPPQRSSSMGPNGSIPLSPSAVVRNGPRRLFGL